MWTVGLSVRIRDGASGAGTFLDTLFAILSTHLAGSR